MAVVIVVAGTGAALWWTVSRPPSRVYLEVCWGEMAVNIIYLGKEGEYLTSNYFPEPFICSAGYYPPASTISVGFSLHSYDPTNTHVILSLTLLSPYSLAGSSPSAPATIAAGGNLSFSVTAQIPSAPGSYGGPSASITAS